MTVAELKVSARQDKAPPAKLTLSGQALWWLWRGDWDAAHQIAQDMENAEGAWLHALVHLYEGDVSNAHYWFHQADRPAMGLTQKEKTWEQIAAHVKLSS